MHLKKKSNIDFGSILLASGLVCQLVVFFLTNDTLLSLLSGIAGMVSVVRCSERKMSFYLWSFLQMVTYTIICCQSELWGKVVENGFYFLTMLGGLFVWKSNLDDESLVKSKSLEGTSFVGLCLATFGLIMMAWPLLERFGSTQPMFDASTTVIGIVAQILMMLRFRENWILWFVQDVLCIAMWVNAENWCMVAQYVFWTINTIYGYIKWRKIW